MALSSSSLHGKTGEGPSGAGGDRFGRSAPRRRPGVEGKGGGGSAGSIPNRSSARGGLRWPGHCGRWRRRWRPWAGVPEGRRRPRGGESTSGPRWCPNPPQIEPRGSGEGCSAVASDGDGARRRCRLEKKGLGWRSWLWWGWWSSGVLRGPFYRRPRRWRGVRTGWPAGLATRLLGGVNGVRRALPERSCRRGGAASSAWWPGVNPNSGGLLLRRRRR